MAKNKPQPNDTAHNHGCIRNIPKRVYERKRPVENIIKKTNELVNEFKNCGPYIEYMRIKSTFGENPGLKTKLAEFEKASELFENKRLQGEISFDEERVISSMYTELWLSEDGRAYLESKNELYKILGDIFEIIENQCAL